MSVASASTNQAPSKPRVPRGQAAIPSSRLEFQAIQARLVGLSPTATATQRKNLIAAVLPNLEELMPWLNNSGLKSRELEEVIGILDSNKETVRDEATRNRIGNLIKGLSTTGSSPKAPERVVKVKIGTQRTVSPASQTPTSGVREETPNYQKAILATSNVPKREDSRLKAKPIFSTKRPISEGSDMTDERIRKIKKAFLTLLGRDNVFLDKLRRAYRYGEPIGEDLLQSSQIFTKPGQNIPNIPQVKTFHESRIELCLALVSPGSRTPEELRSALEKYKEARREVCGGQERESEIITKHVDALCAEKSLKDEDTLEILRILRQQSKPINILNDVASRGRRLSFDEILEQIDYLQSLLNDLTRLTHKEGFLKGYEEGNQKTSLRQFVAFEEKFLKKSLASFKNFFNIEAAVDTEEFDIYSLFHFNLKSLPGALQTILSDILQFSFSPLRDHNSGVLGFSSLLLQYQKLGPDSHDTDLSRSLFEVDFVPDEGSSGSRALADGSSQLFSHQRPGTRTTNQHAASYHSLYGDWLKLAMILDQYYGGLRSAPGTQKSFADVQKYFSNFNAALTSLRGNLLHHPRIDQARFGLLENILEALIEQNTASLDILEVYSKHGEDKTKMEPLNQRLAAVNSTIRELQLSQLVPLQIIRNSTKFPLPAS